MTKAEKAKRWADMIMHHIEQREEERFINRVGLKLLFFLTLCWFGIISLVSILKLIL
jgi:hypothetical protein